MATFDVGVFFDLLNAHNATGWKLAEDVMAGSIYFERELEPKGPAGTNAVQVYATPFWEDQLVLDVDITYPDDNHITIAIPIGVFDGAYFALVERYLRLMTPILAVALLVASTKAEVTAFSALRR
jgi:hypothetical protein